MSLGKKMSGVEAYLKAKDEGWSIEVEDIACKEARWAYMFARYVEGADIERCQEAACKKPEYAYRFAFSIKGADIERCQEAACKEAYWAYYFACNIPGASIEKIKELCPEISDELDEMVMERALK